MLFPFKQNLTHWVKEGTNDDGSHTYSVQQVTGRYEIKQELFITADGQEKASQSVAYFWEETLSHIPEEGDWLALGVLSDTDDPQTVNEAYLVQRVSLIKDLDSASLLVKAWMV